jgi:hypothetical protein
MPATPCRLLCAVAACLICLPAAAGDCCGEKKTESARAETPQECFKAAACAMHEGNLDGVWAMLSEASRAAIEKKGEEAKKAVAACEETQKSLGLTPEKAKELSGRDAVLLMMAARVKEAAAKAGKGCGEEEKDGAAAGGEGCCGEDEKCCELSDVKIDGEKATAKCPLGMPLAFVKEKGGWRLDVTEMLAKVEGCEGDEDGCCEGCEKEAEE